MKNGIENSFVSVGGTRKGADPSGTTALAVVLIFATDMELRAAIAHSLHLNFRTQGADTVSRALGQWRATQPALVIIDLVLEGGSGLEMLVEIRRSSTVPIIVISSDTSPETCVLAFRLGADDFVVKPCDMTVLGARVEALLRRSANQAVALTRLGCAGHLDIDLESNQVVARGREVHLTRLEFDMLAHMASNARQVFTREQLLEAVWLSRAEWQAGATVTEHMRRLRFKLGDSADHITTVYGRGYRFDACSQASISSGASNLARTS